MLIIHKNNTCIQAKKDAILRWITETRLKLRGRKPVFTKEMKETVISLLEEGYSPEQIKGRSNVEGFAMVSHETMYR